MTGKVHENQIFVHSMTAAPENVFSNNTDFSSIQNSSNDMKNKSLKNLNKKSENNSVIFNKEMNLTNNPFISVPNNGLKKLVEVSMKYSNTILPGNPSIYLKFPNPYDKNTDPASYM